MPLKPTWLSSIFHFYKSSAIISDARFSAQTGEQQKKRKEKKMAERWPPTLPKIKSLSSPLRRDLNFPSDDATHKTFNGGSLTCDMFRCLVSGKRYKASAINTKATPDWAAGLASHCCNGEGRRVVVALFAALQWHSMYVICMCVQRENGSESERLR